MKLHFTVNFQHLTKLARDEWCAGNFDWALDLLMSMDLTRAHANDVLNGQYCLAQAPDGRKGIDGTLLPDTWQPSNEHCAYGQFINPDTYQIGTGNILRQGMAHIAKTRRFLIHTLNAINQTTDVIARRELIRSLETIAPRDWVDCGVPYALMFVDNRITVNLNLVADLLVQVPKKPKQYGLLDSDLQDVLLEEELQALPHPTSVSTSKNGFITPNGKFYPCRYMEHATLVHFIETMLHIPETKLIKCAQSQIRQVCEIYPGGDRIAEPQAVTALEYCSTYNARVPYWLQHILDSPQN